MASWQPNSFGALTGQRGLKPM